MSRNDASFDAEDLVFDREHIWHPYSSMRTPLPTYPVVAASGVRLELADGTQLIDGMSSWWAAIHGYNHPVLNQALTQQLQKFAHVMFGGFTHQPAIDLARLLLEITPPNLTKVFFSDSGSVAVEVACKMALQYWHVQGDSKKTRFLALRSGYHGDTFQAMSVCDPVTGMHEIFSGILAEQLFAPSPVCGFDDEWQVDDLVAFQEIVEHHHQEIAAVILEPIVQGAGGMRFYHPNYLKGVRDLCDRHGLLLIADEIATGFGRSGKLFACEHADIEPDILCLGKAITGGYLSFAATLATDSVSDVIGSGSETGGVLMHGPTYMGNPLACAVALANVRLLLDSEWCREVNRIQAQLQQGLAPCLGLDGVANVRTLGAIGVIEMRDPVDVACAQRYFVEQGVWIRPFSNLVYVMPPYITNDDDLAHLCGAMCNYVADNSLN